MAGALPPNADVATNVTNIAKCRLCSNSFKDPRMLPCLHTFCKRCIETAVMQRPADTDPACPTCGRDFNIPEGGSEYLFPNIFLQNYFELLEASCAARGSQADLMCHNHPGGESSTPAFDCGTISCSRCCLETASSRFSDCAPTAADVLVPLMRDNVRSADVAIGICRTALDRAVKDRARMTEKSTEAKTHIRRMADELKQLIDEHARGLERRVDEIEAEQVEDIGTNGGLIKERIVLLEQFKAYAQHLAKYGKGKDIIEQAQMIRHRKKELLNCDIAQLVRKNVDSFDIVVSAGFISEELRNDIFGRISIVQRDDGDLYQPVLTHKLPREIDAPREKGIAAIALLDQRLFVVRENSDRVEEYDGATLQLRRNLLLLGLGDRPSGIAACQANNCIYVVDPGFRRGFVHRMELAGTNAVVRWDLPDYPDGIAVERLTRNVVIVFGQINRLRSYTTDGQPVREIDLEAQLAGAFHAVQLANGRFVVSQGSVGSGVQRVCTVGSDGRIDRKYQGPLERDAVRLKCPRQLAVESLSGCVLVADSERNRVVAFDKHLRRAHVMPLYVDDGMVKPTAVALDESRGRLYVGESGGGGRIFAFDNVLSVKNLMDAPRRDTVAVLMAPRVSSDDGIESATTVSSSPRSSPTIGGRRRNTSVSTDSSGYSELGLGIQRASLADSVILRQGQQQQQRRSTVTFNDSRCPNCACRGTGFVPPTDAIDERGEDEVDRSSVAVGAGVSTDSSGYTGIGMSSQRTSLADSVILRQGQQQQQQQRRSTVRFSDSRCPNCACRATGFVPPADAIDERGEEEVDRSSAAVRAGVSAAQDVPANTASTSVDNQRRNAVPGMTTGEDIGRSSEPGATTGTAGTARTSAARSSSSSSSSTGSSEQRRTSPANGAGQNGSRTCIAM